MNGQTGVPDGVPARALEPHWYLDEDVYRRERERLFFRTWQYAGHASRLTVAGDYFCFAILDQELFCVRDRDGTIRAFYNVCQHRGHELLQGEGNRRSLVCPYHAWSYHLDGHLQRAPHSERVPGFDAGAICLSEVRVESFGGFLFVNLDQQARPMGEWFGGAETQLRTFVPQIEQLRPLEQIEVDEACNWKLSVENYSECYHCRLNHPTFSNGVINPNSYNVMPQDYCLRHTTDSANPERMSYPVDLSANEHAGDYSSWFLWPAFSFQVYPGNLLNTYHWQPQGAARVRVTRGWYSVGGEPSEIVSKLARQDRDTTVAEDIRLVESQYRGLHSRGYRPGPLVVDPNFGVNSEHSVQALHRWLREAVE